MQITKMYSPDVELFVDGGSGVGATATKVRRFTTVQKNTLGSYATFTQDVNNGDKITINIPGVYAVQYSDAVNAGNDCIGISLNASVLTTGISSLTYAQGRRATGSSGSASGYICTVTTLLRCVAGDIIRAQFTSITGASVICTLKVMLVGS